MSINKIEIAQWFKSLQDAICESLSIADGKEKFAEEFWQRKEGGGGRTRILQNGHVIEKGGVNFSEVYGDIPDFLVREHPASGSQSFYATGLSIVIHPINPWVPIIHMNIRYFELGDAAKWFGGGIDLTPHYVDEADASFFHESLKKVCDQFNPSYYPEFNKWAEDYFYIKHRKETRGIGGLFFDRLGETNDFSLENRFEFIKAVGKSFAPVYTVLLEKNKDRKYGEREKQWQYIRRGRYAEFNLVYDKGTRFGLETNGRIESILMSLPPQANWVYNFQPEKDSPEEKTLTFLHRDM